MTKFTYVNYTRQCIQLKITAQQPDKGLGNSVPTFSGYHVLKRGMSVYTYKALFFSPILRLVYTYVRLSLLHT